MAFSNEDNQFLTVINRMHQNLMNKTLYTFIPESIDLLKQIFNECIQCKINQHGCILVGRNKDIDVDCYLHFYINPGKKSMLLLKNST